MLGHRPDVQRQADRSGGFGEGSGPEPRCEPAGPGQQFDGLPQDDFPGGRLGQFPPLQPLLSLGVIARAQPVRARARSGRVFALAGRS